MEKRLDQAVQAYLKSCGAVVYKIHGSQYQTGIADLLICYRGRFIALEDKGPDGRPSALQRKRLRDVQKAGGIGEVCYSLDLVRKIVACINAGEEWTNGIY